jgi:WD40 repeat protein/tRNA A-37 threonylcarbamoyl transferase component Bud32
VRQRDAQHCRSPELAGNLPPAGGVPADLAGHPRYRIVRLIGQGGMGAVYEAEHVHMERTVALKVIHRRFTADADAVARFRREVKVAARLAHPKIVTAHDADHAGDTHFLVMEFVAGQSLGDRLRSGGPLPVREACDCARQALRGLQHAHERGMVHRDVKPDNLMLSSGQVKILDFGLSLFAQAQVADATVVQAPPPSGDCPSSQITALGTVMGTPDYIAPEQALNPHAADIRADVYALGCTLYHMLAGRAPFAGSTIADKLLGHGTGEPEPLTKLRPDVPAALAAVVRKMMAKAPAQRYQTPAEAAEALAPFGEPKMGRPLRPWLLAAAVLLALGLGTTAAVLYRLPAGTDEVVLATDDPEIEVVTLENGRIVRIRDPQSKQAWEVDARRYKIGMADAAGGVKIALPNREPFVLKRDDQGNLTVTRLPAEEAPVVRVPAPEELAGRASPADALRREALPTFLQEKGPPELVAVLGTPQFRLRGGNPGSPDFSPDGKVLASASGQDILLFDAATGFPLRTLTGHLKQVMHVVFSKDGKHLASGDSQGEVRLWSVAGERPPRLLKGHQGQVERLAFAPDGSLLATAGEDGIIRLWKVVDGTACGTLAGHKGLIYSLAFSPDGKFLASGGFNETMRLWDVTGRKGLWKEDLPGSGYTTVAFSPDGKALEAGLSHGTRVWDGWREEGTRKVRFTAAWPGDGLLAFTPDGKELLTAPFHHEPERVVVRLNAATGQKTGGFTVPGFTGWTRFGISRDAATLVLAHATGGQSLRVVDAATGKPRFAPVGHVAGANGLAFSPNGRLLASAGSDHVVRLWDLATGKELHALTGHTDSVVRVAFHPDGRTLASASNDHTVRLWDAVTGKQLGVLNHPSVMANVAFSPDGRVLATTAYDGRVRLWRTSTREVGVLFHGSAFGLAFHPSGRELASSGADALVKIWDVETGAVQRILRGHGSRPADGAHAARDVAALPDGSRLVSTGEDGTVRIWSWADGGLLHTLRTVGGPEGWGISVSVRPDGGLLAVAGHDGALHLWGLKPGPTQARVIRLFPPGTLQGWFFAAISPEGRDVATGNPEGTIYLLRLAEKGNGGCLTFVDSESGGESPEGIPGRRP